MRRCVAALGVCLVATPSVAAGSDDVQTFSRDVAPILFAHCAGCHRPGEIAPMSLLDYASVRPWSRAIRAKVRSGEMPPWHADRRYGVFRNARGLSTAEIATIAAWADGGAPEGSRDDLQPLPRFTDGWSHPEQVPPDAVIEMPVAFEVPSDGQLPSFHLYTPVPFDAERNLGAVKLRPSNRAVTHHSGCPPATSRRARVSVPAPFRGAGRSSATGCSPMTVSIALAAGVTALGDKPSPTPAARRWCPMCPVAASIASATA